MATAVLLKNNIIRNQLKSDDGCLQPSRSLDLTCSRHLTTHPIARRATENSLSQSPPTPTSDQHLSTFSFLPPPRSNARTTGVIVSLDTFSESSEHNLVHPSHHPLQPTSRRGQGKSNIRCRKANGRADPPLPHIYILLLFFFFIFIFLLCQPSLPDATRRAA